MKRSHKTRRTEATRRTWIGLLVLLAVCFAQVGWWILDQVNYTSDVRSRLTELHQADAAAAERLVELGVEPAEALAIYPHLEIGEDGFAISSETREALRQERFHHLNRYGWEGTFFLVVLAAVMLVVGGLLRQDAALRHRQENFLAMVTHELKSPLASLKLSLDTLVLRDPAADQRRQLLERMQSDLRRWQNMVSNFLDTSVLENGEMKLERVPLSLTGLAGAAAEAVRPAADEAGVEVAVVSDGEVTMTGDPRAVEVVIRNLLENAVKATGARGGGSVTLRVAEKDGTAVLEVADDGLGFDPRESERLFDKFYRPGEEMTAEVRGSGLGLYLVKRLTTLAGGQVRADSDGPGTGAVFRVQWPGGGEASA